MKIKNTAGAPEHLYEQAKKHFASVPNPPQGSTAYRVQTVFRALLEGEQMPFAWRRLEAVVNAKNFDGQYAEFATQQGEYGYEVFRAVIGADLPNRLIDLMPAARKRDKALAVAKAAGKLIEAMEDTIDWGYFQALHLWMGEDEKRIEMLTRILGEEPLFFSIRLSLNGEGLSFSQVLSALQKDVEQIAALPPIVDETASNRVELVSFVRKFRATMLRLFGKPLDGVTAAIVAELYGELMSEAEIRDMRPRTGSI